MRSNEINAANPEVIFSVFLNIKLESEVISSQYVLPEQATAPVGKMLT